MIRLATVNGKPVGSATIVNFPRPDARLADRGGDLWTDYQTAKLAWDRARSTDDPARELARRAAIAAYNAWAAASGAAPIATSNAWGFN